MDNKAHGTHSGIMKNQREILVRAYKKGKRQLGLFSSYTQYYLSEREFKKLEFLVKSVPQGRKDVHRAYQLMRSAKNLANRGFIKFEKYITKKGKPAKNFLVLTYKGEQKVEMLPLLSQKEVVVKTSKKTKTSDSNGFFDMFKQAFDEMTENMGDDQKKLIVEELFTGIRKYLSI